MPHPPLLLRRHDPLGIAPDLPASPFGPGLVAMAATLTGVRHLSRRRALDFLNNALNVPMRPGGLSNCEAQAARALAGPVAEVHEYVPKPKVWRTWAADDGVGCG